MNRIKRLRQMTLCLSLLLFSAGALAADAAPFLWQVQGAKAKHYLLGSVHLLPSSAQPLPASLTQAYQDTQGVVFESDFATLADPKTQLEMLDAASAPDGLRALISPALYDKLKKRAGELKMPLDTTCDPYKPWFCAMTLELFSFQKAGFTPEDGIDQFFYNRALDDGKPIRWLEDAEAHLALFTQMPDTLGQQFLAAELDDQTSTGESPEELLRIWQTGDIAALEKLTHELKQRHPLIYSRMLADRSRAWLPRLRELLDGDSSELIITGAAHDAGPDGLPALLKAAGYVVQPVTAPAAVAPAAAATVAPVKAAAH
ncbi:MAG: TraB/GumN family protein [Stenotrophobium sp.]